MVLWEDVPVWELVGYRLDRHIRARKRLASTVTGSSVPRNNDDPTVCEHVGLQKLHHSLLGQVPQPQLGRRHTHKLLSNSDPNPHCLGTHPVSWDNKHIG